MTTEIVKAEPAHGTARWLGEPWLSNGKPLLEIDGKVYQLERNFNADRDGYAYILKSILRDRVGATYYLMLTPGTEGNCTCPDFTWRRRQCKHVRAVAALLENRPVVF